MATNFPSAIDTFANPVGTDLLENANPALDHDVQHSNANDAIEALEAKVGVNGSAVTTSHDYKLSGITGANKAVSTDATGQTISDATFTDPQFNFGGDATGDMYYRNSGGDTAILPIGTSAQIIQVSPAGIPEWVSNPAASDASETVKGVVEEATQAQLDAGTAVGETSARLFANPSKIRDRFSNGGVIDTGTATAYAIAPSPAITAYATYQKFTFKALNTNTTGNPTINVNTLGAKTIVNPDGSALVPGQIVAGGVYEVTYDGTNMQISSATPGTATVFTSGTDILNAYHTRELKLVNTSASSILGWVLGGGSPATGLATYVEGGEQTLLAGGSGSATFSTTLFGTSGATSGYDVTNNKAIRLKFKVRFSDTSDIKGFGLCVAAVDIFTAQTDVTNGEIRFVLNGSTMYAQNANGSTATTTDVTSFLTVTEWNTFVIVFTPGVDIKYYINGTLRATHTTNLPTTGSLRLAYGINANSRPIVTQPVSVSIQV